MTHVEIIYPELDKPLALWLSPSSVLWTLSIAEWKALAGEHVERRLVRPIPERSEIEIEVSKLPEFKPTQSEGATYHYVGESPKLRYIGVMDCKCSACKPDAIRVPCCGATSITKM